MYHILQFIYLEKKDNGLSLQIYPHKIKNFEKELSPQKENYIIPNKISQTFHTPICCQPLTGPGP